MLYAYTNYAEKRALGITAGATLGVVGSFLLLALCVMGLCLYTPCCPLKKLYSHKPWVRPYPTMAEETGRTAAASEGGAGGSTQEGQSWGNQGGAPLLDPDDSEEKEADP